MVARATELLRDGLGEVFFLALVPDTTRQVSEFFQGIRKPPHPSIADTWDTSHFGYVTWQEVHHFCAENGLTRSLEVFDFNDGQIYAHSAP